MRTKNTLSAADLTINTNSIELEIQWNRDIPEDQDARINTCEEKLLKEEKKSKRHKMAAEIFMWTCTAICIICSIITLTLEPSGQQIKIAQHILHRIICIQILFCIVYLGTARKNNKRAYILFSNIHKEVCLKDIYKISQNQKKGISRVLLIEVDNPDYIDKDKYISADYQVTYKKDCENKEDEEEYEDMLLVDTLEEVEGIEKAVLCVSEDEVKLQIPCGKIKYRDE